jgi:hypothetical protein
MLSGNLRERCTLSSNQAFNEENTFWGSDGKEAVVMNTSYYNVKSSSYLMS